MGNTYSRDVEIYCMQARNQRGQLPRLNYESCTKNFQVNQAFDV